MRICVLNASYEQSKSDFRGHDPYCDPSRHLPEHTFERHLIEKATAVRQVRDLAAKGFDAFVNLCDGAWDEDRAGIEVVQALERFGQAFTGAGSGFYEPTREIMKMGCRYAGIDTPGFVFARTADDAALALAQLRFPMIVKHPNSYGSVGMTRLARVETERDLRAQLRKTIASFGGALVEEFIEGREFTVLVAEARDGETAPVTYAPMEARFPSGETFKHFDLKWVDYDQMTWVPVDDADLAARLRDVSARFFATLGGSGYGRCDLRLAADGALHMLEINPNCGIFYPEGSYGSADLILAEDPAGHRGFLEHALQNALRRRRRAEKVWEVRYDAKGGYALHAARELRAGEVIDRWEERAQHLVTRAHVEAHWNAQQKRWFRQYAWPLTDEVHVMWSDRPEEWKPLDHGCDPNAWLSGLDLVARRDIAPGERITVDYATFCGPLMEDFECRCGSPLCRGVIRAADHLAPFVKQRYGAHVSDYVRTAQERTR